MTGPRTVREGMPRDRAAYTVREGMPRDRAAYTVREVMPHDRAAYTVREVMPHYRAEPDREKARCPGNLFCCYCLVLQSEKCRCQQKYAINGMTRKGEIDQTTVRCGSF